MPLGRCEALGGEDLHLRLLKVIAVVDLLKDRSGLVASLELLKSVLSGFDNKTCAAALDDLRSWSLIVFRKFADAYAIFEGSDFDIDHAVEQALADMGKIDFASVGEIANLQPIVAKRHYHETGALRWFDVDIVALSEVENAAAGYTPRHGAVGGFFLAVPTQGESETEAEEICRKAARTPCEWDIVIGLSRGAWDIPDLATELSALERVRDETPDLQGDRVARTEVLARVATLQGQLESKVGHAFNSTSWYREYAKAEPLLHAELNSLASDLADARFESAHRGSTMSFWVG